MTSKQSLSTRAFKHLRRITKGGAGQLSDVDIHDLGRRLAGICTVLSTPEEASKRDFDVTDQESAALRLIREDVQNSIVSARTISRSLGYASSRSGHLLLHRPIDKGFLIRRYGRIEMKRHMEGTKNPTG